MPDAQTIIGGPAFAVLNPTLDKTYEFIANIVKDLIDIFPDADFYHLGGDEVNTSGCWTNNPDILKFMKENGIETGDELFKYFNLRLKETLQPILEEFNENATLAHWVRNENIDWEEGSLLQFWGNESEIPAFTKVYQDHFHILSINDKFYFDCGTGNKYGAQLCDPYQTWSEIAVFEPTNYYPEESENLLGGEGTLWSELSSPYVVFPKIFPRLAVISNIFWAQKQGPRIPWGDFVENLANFRNYLSDSGIDSGKIS